MLGAITINAEVITLSKITSSEKMLNSIPHFSSKITSNIYHVNYLIFCVF